MSMSTKQVAERLVELLKEEKSREAIETLYAPDAVSVEAMPEMPMPGSPRGLMGGATTGMDMLLKECDWFYSSNEIHGGDVGEPMVHGDRFILPMSIDLTPRGGPMAGQRMQMSEYCLYTVTAGKISRVEFFYNAEC